MGDSKIKTLLAIQGSKELINYNWKTTKECHLGKLKMNTDDTMQETMRRTEFDKLCYMCNYNIIYDFKN